MPNNHYISRFLILPWRKAGHPLWHYNFKYKLFSEKKSAERIFAKRNLWSENLEKFLQKHTENFSPDFIQRISSLEFQPEWPQYKGLFLLTLFQAARVAHFQTGGSNLETISVYSEEKIDLLVRAARERKKICGFRLPSHLRLFFPDTGIFPFPVNQGGYFEWIFFLPLKGNFCLGLVPNEIDLDRLRDTINFDELVAWSAGTPKTCSTIVIHPDLYQEKNQLETFEANIKRCRDYTSNQVDAINRLHSLINQVNFWR